MQRDGVPFFPVAAQKDMVGMAIVTVGVLVCARLFGPHGPRGVPDPPDRYGAGAGLLLLALFALSRCCRHGPKQRSSSWAPLWPLCFCWPYRSWPGPGEELEAAARCGGERPADCVDRGHAGEPESRHAGRR